MSTYGFKSHRHAVVCGMLCFASLAGLMAWGYYFFELPRAEISLSQRPLETIGFFAWGVLGAYGVGYGQGERTAARYALFTLVIIVCAVTLREIVLI